MSVSYKYISYWERIPSLHIYTRKTNAAVSCEVLDCMENPLNLVSTRVAFSDTICAEKGPLILWWLHFATSLLVCLPSDLARRRTQSSRRLRKRDKRRHVWGTRGPTLKITLYRLASARWAYVHWIHRTHMYRIVVYLYYDLICLYIHTHTHIYV